jgi:hypothetical protein
MEPEGSSGATDPVADDEIWIDPDAVVAPPARRSRRAAPLVGLVLILLGIGAVALAVSTRDDDQVSAGPRTPRDRGERPAPTVRKPSTTTATEVLASDVDATTVPKRTKPVWPLRVGGRPLLFDVRGSPPEDAHDPPRCLYLWADFDGWHLWAAGAGGRTGARGTLTSDVGVAKAVLASPGRGEVTANATTITFDLSGAGDEPLGVDFNPGYFATRLNLRLDGGDLPLCLGQTAERATAPLTLVKSLDP